MTLTIQLAGILVVVAEVHHGEARDRPLPALEVAVQQLDR